MPSTSGRSATRPKRTAESNLELSELETVERYIAAIEDGNATMDHIRVVAPSRVSGRAMVPLVHTSASDRGEPVSSVHDSLR
jgi:hypothetical protein